MLWGFLVVAPGDATCPYRLEYHFGYAPDLFIYLVRLDSIISGGFHHLVRKVAGRDWVAGCGNRQMARDPIVDEHAAASAHSAIPGS